MPVRVTTHKRMSSCSCRRVRVECRGNELQVSLQLFERLSGDAEVMSSSGKMSLFLKRSYRRIVVLVLATVPI